MLQIGTILQWGKILLEGTKDKYEVLRGDGIRDLMRDGVYGGYSLSTLQKYIDEGTCFIISSPNYSSEIY